MKKLSFIVVLIAMIFPTLAYSQRQGYEAYKWVATVENGNRKPISSTMYIMFDGNTVKIDRGYGIDTYKYGGTENGNSIYYRIVNDLYYGSQEDRNQFMRVSPDKKNINLVSKFYNTTQILEKSNSSSAGDMIY